MRTRNLALMLSLGTLAFVGCKSAQPDEIYRAHYTTPPPPGAVVLPAVPPSAAPETTRRWGIDENDRRPGAEPEARCTRVTG